MDNKIKILEDGILKEYDVIGLCKNKELNKDYVIYSDGTNNYAARYILQNGKLVLEDIIDDLEWDYVNKEFEKYG